MYKGIVRQDATVLANTNIPFSTAINSNGNTTPKSASNAVAINTTGYYNIMASLIVTDITTTSVTANILADDNIIATATSDITADTGIVTLTIPDIERVAVAPTPSKVNIAVQLEGAGTILTGSKLIIEKVR